MTVRPATPDDLADIARLVRALAAYERDPESAVATPDHFARALFPEDTPPAAFCHVAESDGRVVGLALWFLSFSTWTGTHGIWLEDLFVEPEHRGRGLGLGLLRTLAGICVERGYQRLEWTVLDWNEPALGFYRRLGAVALDDWTTHRLSGDALGTTAAGTPPVR